MFRRLKHLWYEMEYDYWVSDCCYQDAADRNTDHKWWFATKWFFRRATYRVRALVCRWKGHDWVDTSYGGPDSGCMSGYCKRCDYSFHHTLY